MTSKNITLYILSIIFIFGILKETAGQSIPNSSKVQEEEEELSIYDGKIIRHIEFNIIDVSGPSIDKENGKDTSIFGIIGNSLHYTTRDWVIKNYLLFKPGDTLLAEDIKESERILRNSGLFLEAKINVHPSEKKDSVDVFVITKDRWTITFLFSLSTNNSNSYVGLRDDNLLGLGHSLDAQVTHDQNSAIGWGGTSLYKAANLFGSFVDVAAKIETNKKKDIHNINALRSFLTSKTEWAGGVELQWEKNSLDYFNAAGDFTSMPYKLNSQDLWLGKSFPLWFGDDYFRLKTRIILSGRFSRVSYGSRPFVSSDSNKVFLNTNTLLFSGGIINRRFYKEHFINKFGVTEDIPLGGLFSITGGYEYREHGRRLYAGLEAIYSRRIESAGYFSLRSALGGFKNGSGWEQNIFNLNLTYHSPLFKSKAWKLRLLSEWDLLMGTNRFLNEQVYLDNKNGNRGFNTFSLHGTKRNTLNLEARLFSPFAPLGFVLSGLVFSDLGIIAGKDKNLFSSRLYQSHGIGLRTSNESIARAAFEITLAYIPRNEIEKRDFKILFTSSVLLGFRDFNFSKPETINFSSDK